MLKNKISEVALLLARTWKNWEHFVPKLLLAFIGFVLVVFALQVTGPLANIFAETPNSCNGRLSFEMETRQGGAVGEAKLVGVAVNNCDKDVTLYLQEYWCKNVAQTCADNKNERTLNIDAKTSISFEVSQQVGGDGNGKCGSAQVDAMFSPNWPNDFPKEGVAAWSDKSCEEKPPESSVSCDSINYSVSNTNPFRVTTTVYAKVNGVKVTGSEPISQGKFKKYIINWYANSDVPDGDPKKTFPGDGKDSYTYPGPGTYQIRGVVVDNDGNKHSENCLREVTLTQQYHYVCGSNNTCERRDGPGNNTDGCNATNVGASCGVANSLTCSGISSNFPSSAPVNQPVSLTVLSGGNLTPTEYMVDWGDGVVSSAQSSANFSHTYTSSNPNRTVQASVRNPNINGGNWITGNSCQRHISITDNPTFACGNITPKNQEITVGSVASVTVVGSGTLQPTDYRVCWNGDGVDCMEHTASQANAGYFTHPEFNVASQTPLAIFGYVRNPNYNNGAWVTSGICQTSLRVNDRGTGRCESLTLNPQSGYKPLNTEATITGSAENGGTINGYLINWGDGNTSSVIPYSNSSYKFNHTYQNLGTYTVTGTVQVKTASGTISSNSNCQQVVTVMCSPTECPNTHFACINNTCQIREGSTLLPGEQACDTNCGLSHKACRSDRCEWVSGPAKSGEISCNTNNDCIPEQSHTECVNEACRVVSGAGTNQCTTSANCKSNPTHTVCSNNACQVVNGSGTNQCDSDMDCRRVVTTNIPSTGAETPVLFGLFGSGIFGWIVRKLKFNI